MLNRICKLYFLFFFFFIIYTAHAQEKISDYFVDYLQYLRQNKKDVRFVFASDISNKIHYVENFLERPLDRVDELSDYIQDNDNFEDLLSIIRLSSKFMDYDYRNFSFDNNIGRPYGFSELDFPEVIKDELYDLLFSISESKKIFSTILSSIESDSKEKLMDILLETSDYDLDIDSSENQEEVSTTVKKARFYNKLEHIDVYLIYRSFYNIVLNCERLISKIKTTDLNITGRRRYKTEVGDIIISGNEDDIYDLDEEVILVIDTGGNNQYHGKVASGNDGNISIVIDNGENITIEADDRSCGSGILGIGILYLVNKNGKKIINAGDFSCGTGILGGGALFVEGESEITTGDYSLGSAKFGLGIFYGKNSNNSIYKSGQLSQGAGMVRGLGFFNYEGDGSVMEAGLNNPDPREKKGSTSLSQGFGIGLRAITGGGIGIMKIKGNDNRLISSYMTQGCGYWHALGILSLKGNNNSIIARRYSQGTGVHSAGGIMFLNGNNNSQINWGVGPAYAWDSAVAFYIGTGNENSISVNWGAGKSAHGGSFAFSYFNGDNNKFKLPGYGSGHRGLKKFHSYSIALFKGAHNIFKSDFDFHAPKTFFARNPWGIFWGEDILFDTSVSFPEYEWAPVSVSKKQGDKEKNYLQQLFDKAQKKTGFSRINDYLRVASAFSIWKKLEHEAIRHLLKTEKKETGLVLKLYSPYSVDEIIILIPIINSFGEYILPEIFKYIRESTGMWKIMYMSLLKGRRMEKTIPFLLELSEDADWRVKTAAVRIMGYLLSKETYPEYGRLSFFKKCLELCKKNSLLVPDSDDTAAWLDVTKGKDFREIFSVLTLTDELPVQIKIELYNKNPKLFEGDFKKARIYFGNLLIKNRKKYRSVIKNELHYARNIESRVRRNLIKLLDTDDYRIKTAVIRALGQIGNGQDLATVLKYIKDDSVKVRNQALVAVSRMKSKGYRSLKKLFKQEESFIKSYIPVSSVFTDDPEFIDLIGFAIKDADPFVKLSGLSSILSTSQTSKKRLKKYIPVLEKMKETESDGLSYMIEYVLRYLKK